MTRKQKQSALELVAKKNSERGCPVCGKAAWKIQGDAGLPHAAGGAKIHVIPVVCRSCGLMLLFNSIIAESPVDEDLD